MDMSEMGRNLLIARVKYRTHRRKKYLINIWMSRWVRHLKQMEKDHPEQFAVT